MTTLEVVYEDDWATATLKALHEANDQAKAISRRGMSAMLRDEYAAAHRKIDGLLTLLEELSDPALR